MSGKCRKCSVNVANVGKCVQKKTSCSDPYDIPAETIVLTSNRQIEKMYIKKHQEKRIVKLFICHLLDENKVQMSSERENFYSMGNMTFKRIQVRGVITDLTVIVKNKTTYIYSVDDSTGTLDCCLIKNELLEELRSKTQTLTEDSVAFLQNQRNNPVFRASLMMLQNTREQLKKFLPYSEFALGDTVELVGKLTEYNGKRNCFIQSICKVDTVYNSNYYEELENLYTTIYS